MFSTRVCWLKTQIGTKVATSGSKDEFSIVLIFSFFFNFSFDYLNLIGISGQRKTLIVNPIGSTCNIESGFVYNNNDLAQPIILATPSDCCDRCGLTTGCVAWSYLNDYKYCYLKSALPTSANRVAYQNSYSGVRNTATPTIAPATTCLIRTGVIFPGGDLAGLYLASPSDCCNRCGVTNGCVAWDFLTDSKYCFMKHQLPTAARQTVFQNAVSGIRR